MRAAALRMLHVAASALLLAALAAHSARAEQIAAPEAFARSAAGELVIIDVRRPGEWRETGLPQGAVGISFQTMLRFERSAFVEDVLAALAGDRTRPVAVICAAGVRSARAEAKLEAAGFTAVYDINEGMLGSPRGPGWVERGLPVAPCVRC